MEKNSNQSLANKIFRLKDHKTDVKTEIMAGITTFMTMSYILAVNPQILGDAGMDKGAVFTATIISSIIAILIMAFYANLPFALAPGMGLNAFFTYTVVMTMGKSWEFALAAVFIEGIVFIILSIFNVREAIFNAIPRSLKTAVSVGIGLFIALIGLLNSTVIVKNDVGLGLGNLVSKESFIFFIGLLIMAVLTARKTKGALLIGIIISTIIAIFTGVSKLPEGGIIQLPPSLSPIFLKLDFSSMLSFEMFSVVFAFLFVDLFDTVGTLTGVATKAKMLDENGELPNAGRALFADSIGTTLGALLGTSTVTTFVESATGVAEGGRTGLTALSAGFCFFLSIFFYPLITIIPPQATAAALVMVGLFMIDSIVDINFGDFTESFPAFMTIIMMPFAYSIAEGIAFGMISYASVKLLTGKGKEVSPLVYVLALVFLLRYIFPLFG
ncbi:NCS2 family permease [Anaerococcus hydrogenalis]|uniref:NCS2 family permease n=2 Tax=Anaerococcus hydrogenalis TaxID=33029 RepID=A0A2N6UH41_9FIRM|nr:NCS2 family permease [Anaerococcus hydrogenalis]EEB35929.1 putative permease [Anaerococcus hydrogenalis DSM 7454]MDK7695703.1 NCS2 family permease [Anaerococcus hydrogenalis]MDK7697474.1 NCS2 family permease [Anaerococcus hydrogenalis]MDK7708741.1 NCS2 family permease [Anaerococcus hydrogenalis]PMC80824.1 NCS2 family permease [Anaerococcus hydrogenalis]